MLKYFLGIGLIVIIGSLFYVMYLFKDFFNDDDERI